MLIDGLCHPVFFSIWVLILFFFFFCDNAQIQKKKIWELVQPHLKTDVSCIAMLGEHVMRTSVGSVACQSLQNANIS